MRTYKWRAYELLLTLVHLLGLVPIVFAGSPGALTSPAEEKDAVAEDAPSRAETVVDDLAAGAREGGGPVGDPPAGDRCVGDDVEREVGEVELGEVEMCAGVGAPTEDELAGVTSTAGVPCEPSRFGVIVFSR